MRRTLVLQQLYEDSASSFLYTNSTLLCHSDTSLPQHRLRRNLRVLECKMGKHSRRQLYCRVGSIELPADAVPARLNPVGTGVTSARMNPFGRASEDEQRYEAGSKIYTGKRKKILNLSPPPQAKAEGKQ